MLRSTMVNAAAVTAVRLGRGLMTVLVLACALTACTATGDGPGVGRVVVCAGPDAQHPAGALAQISLRQGGREVASASVPYGTLVALLVPSAQTAVFIDGVDSGAAGFAGDAVELDPASQPAPDAATIAAAAATDPATVEGYIGITGPGCPPASDIDVG